MSDKRLTFSTIRYEESWTSDPRPDPYPEIVLGDEQRAEEALTQAIRRHFDRALFALLVPGGCLLGVKDVTPNTLEASNE